MIMSLNTVLEALQDNAGMTRFEADVFMRGGCGDVVVRAEKKAQALGFISDAWSIACNIPFWDAVGVTQDMYDAALIELD